jgi:hypothetical protein
VQSLALHLLCNVQHVASFCGHEVPLHTPAFGDQIADEQSDALQTALQHSLVFDAHVNVAHGCVFEL